MRFREQKCTIIFCQLLCHYRVECFPSHCDNSLRCMQITWYIIIQCSYSVFSCLQNTPFHYHHHAVVWRHWTSCEFNSHLFPSSIHVINQRLKLRSHKSVQEQQGENKILRVIRGKPEAACCWHFDGVLSECRAALGWCHHHNEVYDENAMKSLIHSQTSTVQLSSFRNG